MEKHVNYSENKQVFTSLYEHFGFGSEESRSGPGSTLEETKDLRDKIVNLIKERNIKSIVDIPCGDWNWMKEISNNFESYIGGDIVDECVADNNQKFGNEKVKFINFDLLKDEIPEGDLLIVRDVIGHYPIMEGNIIINNILKSNCKYLLTTTSYNISNGIGYSSYKNNDVSVGRFYMVNLMDYPFSLPKPIDYIEEIVRIDGYDQGERKVMALWDLTSLKKLYEMKLNTEVLEEIVLKNHTDKKSSYYTEIYATLFNELRNEKINLLEIGLGTAVPDVPSTFIGWSSQYENFKPSSCLKVWKEYFPNANIYGIDNQEDCIISEDRIETFLFDSTDRTKSNEMIGALKFDIIIDDGLHTADGQYKTFLNFFHRLNDGGIYIIEDVGGGGDGMNVFLDYHNELKDILNQHEYFWDYDILIIKKNNSKNGCHMGEFSHMKRFNEGFLSFINSQKDACPCDNKVEEFFRQEEIKKTEVVSETPKVVSNFEVNKNLTIVTGLWNIGRPGRDFSHYIEHFKMFLDIPQNLFIYIPKEYEYLVWERRSKENTFVKIYELDDVKNLYNPFWDKTQEIRTNPNWFNQSGWLPGSPQAHLEWYNPIVQSKMFMLNDATIWNPFNTEYFFWLDAGITNTVPHTHLTENNVLDKLTNYGNPFLFLSYPYQAENEIHGFTFGDMNRIARTEVKYVCRGGLFGGHKHQINEANATYYSMLANTLNLGLMGTEESLFTLMSYNEPHLYKRFELDGNGLIVKFTQSILDNNVTIVEPSNVESKKFIKYTDRDVEKYKTNLYILTFNFPEQLIHTINSMKKTPEWLTKPHLVLLDNSTIEESKELNKKIASEHNFEYIDLGGNTGICGGRQSAAEHFHNSDADFMFFFEDDMTSNPPEFEGQFCRNGFRKYIPNLYNLVHRIMLKEGFDFLKLSFTEVYFDNDKQCSWYNVPQTIRTRDWPNYDKLPVSGLDPNVPLTNFKNIRNLDGLSYIDGEIYYANWPMIVSKEGNYKMFIETKWAHPFEQTWMSHIYQKTKEGKIKPSILLASPIWHDRIKHYQPGERREN
jgi:hypothetical protein